MVGNVTKKLLDEKKFPWCLDELFAGVRTRALGKRQSPYEQYVFIKKGRGLILWFWACMGVCGLAGLLNASDPLGGIGGVSVTIVSICSIGCIASMIMLALLSKDNDGVDRKNDLWTFEKSLVQILNLLVGSRELADSSIVRQEVRVECMTTIEVQHLARQILIARVEQILNSERAFGPGCIKSNWLRADLKKEFDLFKMYGLLNPGEEDYRPFFDEAKMRIESQPQVVAEAAG